VQTLKFLIKITEITMTLPSAPPVQFNFAQFLIALNNSRKDKTALIDDVGSLSYGQLGVLPLTR
jgi:hypothetical protein